MAQKQKLIEEKLAAILEEENRKHVTHVGFAIIAIYKDGRSVVKTGIRQGQGYGMYLSEAAWKLSNDKGIYND